MKGGLPKQHVTRGQFNLLCFGHRLALGSYTFHYVWSGVCESGGIAVFRMKEVR